MFISWESNIPDLGLVSLGIVLIAIGFFLVLVVVIVSAAKNGELKGRARGVVIIGFIPIIFGTDKQSAKLILILSIILVGLLIILFLLQLPL